MVGGEPTEDYLQMRASLGLDNVHFVGFQKKEALSRYYRAADLFVLPTREDIWGLVINEAMAYGPARLSPPTGALPVWSWWRRASTGVSCLWRTLLPLPER